VHYIEFRYTQKDGLESVKEAKQLLEAQLGAQATLAS